MVKIDKKLKLYELKHFIRIGLSKFEFFWLISATRFILADKTTNLKIISGCDSSHFKSLLNLLESIEKQKINAVISIWDLGLNKNELLELNSRFPNCKLTKFDFSKYPPYFDIKKNAGEYAWKTAIIFEEFKSFQGLILWLDSGNIVSNNLMWLRKFTNSRGFFSPYSQGFIFQWTHPEMLNNLNLSEKFLFKPNLNGAIVAFDTKSKSAEKLVRTWFECAINKDCIAPPGSSRLNHRQDQASLTCLAYSMNIAPNGTYATIRKRLGIRIHQDVE